MSNLTDSKRLQGLLDALSISAHKLSLELEYKAPASIYHVIEGLNTLSSGMRDRIISRYPNVNPEYLKHGELPILLSRSQVAEQSEKYNINNKEVILVETIKSMLKIPEKLDRIIELLEDRDTEEVV